MDEQLPDRWSEQFSHWIAKWVPDAITTSVILTILMFGVVLALGNPFGQVMEAYHQGLWMLLPFTMQMTLIIVLSSALGATPFLRRAIAALARVPQTTNQIVALAFLSNGIASYLYWGLGYALGPVIAIHFAAEGERKGIRADFPFLLAVTYSAQALWQFGLSSSGPLLAATSGHFLQSTIGVIPLSTTIWSPAAIIHEVVYAAAAIVTGCWLMPKICRPISQFPESCKLTKAAESVVIKDVIRDVINDGVEHGRKLSPAERLERSPLVALTLCTLLAGWIVFVTVKTAMAVGVTVQRGMLALGVGDHMGNFLTPFWYVVVASIARVDFRCFFGYGPVFAALWFVIGVVVFTFAPC